METINLTVGDRIDFAGYQGTVIKEIDCPFSKLHIEAEMDDGRTLTFTRDGKYLPEQTHAVVTVMGKGYLPPKKYYRYAYYVMGDWEIAPVPLDDEFMDQKGKIHQLIKERPHQRIDDSMEVL